MKKLSVLSLAHFAVDLCCAAQFFGRLGHGADWWLCMVLYNACAFALQLPLGLLADRSNRDLPFAAAGWAYDVPEIRAFMKENTPLYFETTQALYRYLFE